MLLHKVDLISMAESKESAQELEIWYGRLKYSS